MTRADECKAVGAGFRLQPSGMDVLRELGILDGVLALADVSCLAACIARHPLPQALRLYQRRRGLPLRYYQFATRWLTPWFQSDHEWLTPLSHLFFGLTRKIPWARRFMTRTMAGLVGSERGGVGK